MALEDPRQIKPYGTVGQNVADSAADDKRTAILKIALDAFLAEGYAAVSMSRIAAELGGSKGTLYNYFASKEELFSAVVARKCEVVREAIFQIDRTVDFTTQLRSLGTCFVEAILSDDSIATYRLVTAEAARFPELGRSFYEAGPVVVISQVATFLSDAVKAGHLRKGDMEVAARQFLELCKADIQHKRLWNIGPAPTETQIGKQVDEAVATFLAAYGTDR